MVDLLNGNSRVVTVIIVAIAIVVTVVLVVVDAIIGVILVVGGVSSIIKLLFVIIVTVPLILWGNPPIKTSISFSMFGTIFGHKAANYWNLLTLFKPANEANCSFRTIEVERLTAYELFIVSFSCYRSFSWSGVPIDVDVLLRGILST
uniref:Uncharacterized protein n=1 Tax=Tanacetum cinerariifolium TaxID=118510 RepID=A0A699Q026_TANCI|nr:hypothetical protein [Tanacetum cinerariifolium]